PSNFTDNTGNNVVASAPWVHTGLASFSSVSNINDTLKGGSAWGKAITWNSTAGIYQDITASPLNKPSSIDSAYVSILNYKARIAASGGGTLRVALVNSITDSVYDEQIIQTPSGGVATSSKYIHEISLTGIAG